MVEVSYWNGIEYAADHCVLERPVVPDSFRIATLADIGGTNLYTGDSSILVTRNINMGQTGKIIFNSNDIGGTTRSILEFETDYSSDDTFVDYLQMKFEDTGIRDSLFLRNVDKGFRIGSGSLLGIYSDSSLVLGQFNVPTILDGAKRATDRNTFKMFPNFTTTQRDAILSPESGMGITNTTKDSIEVYFNGQWYTLGSSLSSSFFNGDYVILIDLDGQSNAGGNGLNIEADPLDTLDQPQLQFWNSTASAFQTYGPNNRGYTVAFGSTQAIGEHGVELGLAKYFQDYFPGDTLYMVKNHLNGAPISEFMPDRAYFTSHVNQLDSAITYLKSQGKIPLVFRFFMQGESDSGPALVNAYPNQLKRLNAEWRKLLGQDLHIVGSEMTNPSAQDGLNDHLRRLALEDTRYHLVRSKDYARNPNDGSHFSAAGLLDIARDQLEIISKNLNTAVITNDTFPMPNHIPQLNPSIEYDSNNLDLDFLHSKIHHVDLTAQSNPQITFNSIAEGDKGVISWYNNFSIINWPSNLYAIGRDSTLGPVQPTDLTEGIMEFYASDTAFYVLSPQYLIFYRR